MSTYRDIRQQTAEKLARPANGQQPIQGCVIPAHLQGQLASIRARCAASVAKRDAAKETEQQQQHEGDLT